jgi:thiamine biosynthesis lipoprotein
MIQIPEKQTRILMGMPITLEIINPVGSLEIFDKVFNYFEYIDQKFSTYKPLSEISMLNKGLLDLKETSLDMMTVLELAEGWRQTTRGYFNIRNAGLYDPSGLVKGWAISNAAEIIRQAGFSNYYVDAGGDFQVAGHNRQGQKWRVGVRNPFNMQDIVKVLSVSDCGVATSGTYIRGEHIYDPVNGRSTIQDITSMTVIGSDIYAADCYATAAFAMGRDGINFIETLDGFEGYMIDMNRVATFTSGFESLVYHAEND